MTDRRSTIGALFGFSAFGMWGVLVVYWKQLDMFTAYEIIAHRMVWTLVFGVMVVAFRKRWEWLRPALLNPRLLLVLLAAAALLTMNWFIYLWAIKSGRILDASLGYFINPLLSVAVGVIIFHERPRRWQWVAIGLAVVGVLYLTIMYGAFPWVALGLAGTFVIYSAIKKQVSLDAVASVTLEAAFMFIPASIYLLYMEATGHGVLSRVGLGTGLLLAGSGVITATPLILFAAAVRRVTLTTVGLLQYIAPTLQFLIGAFLYGEPVTPTRLAGFVCIWIALMVFSVDAIRHARASRIDRMSLI